MGPRAHTVTRSLAASPHYCCTLYTQGKPRALRASGNHCITAHRSLCCSLCVLHAALRSSCAHALLRLTLRLMLQTPCLCACRTPQHSFLVSLSFAASGPSLCAANCVCARASYLYYNIYCCGLGQVGRCVGEVCVRARGSSHCRPHCSVCLQVRQL